MIRKALIMVSLLGIGGTGITFVAPAWAGEKAGQAGIAAPVKLNTAEVQELARVEGLDEAKAAAIVDYRLNNGPFRSTDDLTQVKGISQADLEVIRPQVTLE